MFRIIFDIIINAEIADSQLPRSDWIRTHRFTIPCFNSRLILQLSFNCVKNSHLLARCKDAKMIFGVWGIFNSIFQSKYPFKSAADVWHMYDNVFRCKRSPKGLDVSLLQCVSRPLQTQKSLLSFPYNFNYLFNNLIELDDCKIANFIENNMTICRKYTVRSYVTWLF